MKKIIDGAQSVAQIAYKLSQIIPIYPITPSTPMAEEVSKYSTKNIKNILDEDVKVIEMQSESGVSGTLHGALMGNALSTTFTSSQGLLLMLPNLYKLAGENLPAVIHVSARSIASHALSIFCDHSDIMAVRSSGVIIIASDSVQSSHDLALASHMLALRASLPVIHFMDGFRTSHEIQKIETFDDEDIKNLTIEDIKNFKMRSLNRQFGTAQNPDTFFQNRMAREPLYLQVKPKINQIFKQIENNCGRKYSAFEYYGDEKAERVIVAMGSSCKTIEEYIDSHKEDKIGLVKVVLFRPFFSDLFMQCLPKTTKMITVLDRTKESASIAPLALDVIASIRNSSIKILSGVYGLGGKEFSPACVKAVYENMQTNQIDNFSVGINDDINKNSLILTDETNKDDSFGIKIFGLGSDGSVSASKSTIKIIGEIADKNVQGYFEYDSKKAGSLTTSHIRISENKIKSEYLLKSSNVICINNFSFVHRYDCLKGIKQNGIVVINSIFDGAELDKVLPFEFVQTLKEKQCKLFVIDGQKIATEHNLGNKINIIMQAALFVCTNFLTECEIEKQITKEIEKTFSIKGKEVVEKNIKAMKCALKQVHEIDFSSFTGKKSNTTQKGNIFYDNVMYKIERQEGDQLPVSVFEKDGSAPLETTIYQKRAIALNLPQFIKENCIQCGTCTLACPHSAITSLLVEEKNVREEDKKDFIKA